MEKFTTIHSPQDIGLWHIYYASEMQPPELKKMLRSGSVVWRLTVAGMTRYYRHDWQAKAHYHFACLVYLAKRAMN